MQPLVTAAEMTALDRRASAELQLPSRALMEVAGRRLADVVAALLRRRVAPGGAPRRRAVVVAGPGNNGGDGAVAARALAARGAAIDLVVVAPPGRLRGDAAAALVAAQRGGGCRVHHGDDGATLAALAAALAAADLAVDALLGTGLRAAARGPLAAAIEALNAAACPVVACDLPSGIDADTGAAPGAAVRATHTVAFGFAKRGHLCHPGAAHTGRLVVVDIGIPRAWAGEAGARAADGAGAGAAAAAPPPAAVAASPAVVALGPADGPALWRPRPAAAHKGNFGHRVVWAGAPATPGAARLALRAALRAGAGRVSWAARPATLEAAAAPDEVMLRRLEAAATPAASAAALLAGAAAAVVGPGLGQAAEDAALLAAVLRAACVPLCLDADALNLLAAQPALWALLPAATVLTPHPKEMARLMACTVPQVQADRIGAAQALAQRRRCVVVLKGAGTVVAAPHGAAAVVGAGNAGMATGGSGDVLAGVVGGLLAQGPAPVAWAPACYGAACAAALAHAVAGDVAARRRGQAGLCAGDLPAALGTVWRQWHR